MRATGLLLTFASLDVGLVVVAGTSPSGGGDLAALRIPMLAIIAITAIGLVALAALSFAARLLARLRVAPLRAFGAFAIGCGYAGAILGCLGWAALWLTPAHALVALAGMACAALIGWQCFAEAQFPLLEREDAERGE